MGALDRVGEDRSTRVDEGRKCRIFAAEKMKDRPVVGRREKSRLILGHPESELRLWREKENRKIFLENVKSDSVLVSIWNTTVGFCAPQSFFFFLR